MRITLKNVEENVKPLSGRLSYDIGFIFELLAAYGRSRGNITRLRNGQLNVADDPTDEVAQKGVLYFKPTTDNLYGVIDDLKSSPTVVRYSTRFVMVTDYKDLLAIDTRTGETLDIALRDIDKHYTFFLPWAGMEKAQFIAENHADVKAAEKMAKLFDTLIAYNGFKTADEWHNLTTFFTRLLFCFFAEDTSIFKKNQFINAIASYTQKDGSDLHNFLLVLFEALDDEDKEGYPAYLAAFPYVNGKLFTRGSSVIPRFNKEARDLLIESSSKLDWSNINPDIFGSMFQAVVRPGERTGLGQHYTSVPNIMKTIEPLFLDELKDEFDKAYNDSKRLGQLLSRISKIKIFDPACGSGNFLIIAYKELRRLEHAILERQGELTGHTQQVMFGSRIHIDNFYGIEIDDFAHEVAILSLWLAKHQMNLEFAEKFGVDLTLIPLKEAGNIVRDNAARIDWKDVCPNNGSDEIYLIGNPPYQGSKKQKAAQKNDYKYVFANTGYSKNLDYISLWFIKGAHYIKSSNAQLAFVSTNSVSQGDHVGIFWPHIFKSDLEISFAHTSFKWSNNAKGNAGVICVIIGLRQVSDKPKYLFTDGTKSLVENINPYLAPSHSNLIIERRKSQIAGLPKMVFGSMPRDGGFLVLSESEANNLQTMSPHSRKFIKKYYGSAEFLRRQQRYCLWIKDTEVPEVTSIGPIQERLIKVSRFRAASDAKSTRDYSMQPHRFVQISYEEANAVLVPEVSSERREYLQVGYVDKNTVISNKAFAIYNAEPYVLGLLSSKMHMVWVKAISGRMKSDISYSSTIAYNNFPIPTLTESDKHAIQESAFAILDAREHHPDKTLADLYDPDKMPDDLRLAHQELDEVVEHIYRKKPFTNDEERLAHLFDLYEAMAIREKEEILV